MTQKRILVVENNPNLRKMMALMLSGAGYDVDMAEDLIGAARLTDDKTYHLAMVDLSLSKMTDPAQAEDYGNREGVSLLERLRGKKEGTRTMVVSGNPETQVVANALLKSGADAFLSKKYAQQAEAGFRELLLSNVAEQLELARLNVLDGHENPVRCITQGRDTDIWLHNAVAALAPANKDRGLMEHLKAFLDELGPARRMKTAPALLEVHPKIGVVEGVFWSKSLGSAVHAVLASPMVGVEGFMKARYGAELPVKIFDRSLHNIRGCAFENDSPRSGFVEP